MLQSKFSKKNDSFKAQKLFTDRTEPREVFRRSMLSLADRPKEIINYYGKGGIGKTTLLKKIIAGSPEVYAQIREKTVYNVFVSLDAFEYGNPVNILTAIRSGIQGDCGLFDYAVMQYYAKARMSVEEIRNRNHNLSMTVMGILNEVISIATASASIPVSILDKCISFIKDARIRTKYREEIAEIATLTEFELFERLPYYLGLCIANSAEKKKYHVIFLDSYESMLNRTVGGTPSADPEEWLKELFLASENVRIVIASRDRLRWDRQDPDWGEFLNAHRLNDLSAEDSLWFLERVPVTEPDIAKSIAAHAAGVPLYLDMCVDLYESAKNRGERFDADALDGKTMITDRYMRHLSDKDSYAVRVICVPRVFEPRFAQRLLAMQHLDYSTDELNILLDKSIILPLNEKRSLYKVDESVRNHLLERMPDEQKTAILEDIFACIASEKGAAVFPYFASALDTLIAHPACLAQLYGQVFRLSEFYAGAGYWLEMHDLLKKYTQSENALLRTLAVVIEIIYLRRSRELARADAFIRTHPVTKADAGEWYYLYRFLCIHVRHLMGHYDESLAAYRALLDDMDLVRPTISPHIYHLTAIKYADLLFLKGEFDASLAQTQALLDAPDLSVDDRLELLRLKGHNYRFRRMNEQAERIYASALRFAKDYRLHSANGKLYTNMTETLCCDRPKEALQWYRRSVKENSPIESYIELGKAHAAAAVAYARLREFDRADETAEKALAATEKTGYRAGRAFALAALAYVRHCEGKEEESRRHFLEMKALLEELNVYLYIIGWFEN